MTLLPLTPDRPAALTEAMVRRGMGAVRAEAAAAGMEPIALVWDGLDSDARERIVGAAVRAGVECLSGDGWAVLTGSMARFGGLARLDDPGLPPEFAATLGTFLERATAPHAEWQCAGGTVTLESPVIVGIVNVTPDSFSDGGRYDEPASAVTHGEALVAAGARMLDVGAESTRPGRPESVPVEEEWGRLAPVLLGLARALPHIPVSVDTVKAEIARRALAEGAWAINDVSGLRIDPSIADVCAAAGAGLVLMHSRGSVTDMATYDHAAYASVAEEMTSELRTAVAVAQARGVADESLVLDPGLGFSKTPEQSFAALHAVPVLGRLGYPVMVGPSRKRMLGAVTGRAVDERDHATAAACVAAYALGARLFRVHAPEPTREALAVAQAVRSG